MTQEDLRTIESELGVSLPHQYRATMLNFPVPACAGNSDTYLWDDAAKLITENQMLRGGAPGGVPPWPSHLFCLGRAGGGDVYAIDLRETQAPVRWIDHSDVNLKSSGRDADSFSEWVTRYIRDLRNDLEGDGVNPDGSPEDRAQAESRNARAGCIAAILVTASIVGALIVVRFLV